MTNMTKRERTLMIAVLAIAGCYGIFLLVRSTLLGPLDTQAAQIRDLKSDIASKKKQMELAISASNQLTAWEERSLPKDEGEAQAAYQHLLFRLMKDCHFEDPQVAADKTQKTKYYSSVPFTIRARVSLQNLTEFLYRFYAFEPSILHQIRSLSISRSTDSKNSGLNVTIMVSGLSLENAAHQGPLIEDGIDPARLLIESAPRSKYELIARKNIFEPYREPPKVVERSEPKIDIDTARHVVLTGCTQAGPEPEAWIYNRLTNENKVFRVGDELDLAGIKGKLREIDSSGIVLEIATKPCSLKLGKSFRDFKDQIDKLAVNGAEKKPEPSGAEPARSETESPDSSVTNAGNPDKIGAQPPVDKGGKEPGAESIEENRGS